MASVFFRGRARPDARRQERAGDTPTSSPPPDAYRDDLAAVHDEGFGAFARAIAPGLLDCLRRVGPGGGRVVDLGCGSGIWAEQLVGRGYDVLGVDYSESMLAIARRRAPKAEFRRGSFLDAEIPPCVMVTAMGEVFNYLFDESNGLDRLSGLFRRIQGSLRPGGVLVFDVLVLGDTRGGGEVRRHREGEGWATLVTVEEDRARAILTRRITSFRRVEGGDGTLYRRDHEVHRQRLYRGEELLEALRSVGFRATMRRGLGSFRFDDAHRLFLARKPG